MLHKTKDYPSSRQFTIFWNVKTHQFQNCKGKMIFLQTFLQKISLHCSTIRKKIEITKNGSVILDFLKKGKKVSKKSLPFFLKF